jgi:hypothetical protein
MMDNTSFPRWAGPLVGAGVGLALALRLSLDLAPEARLLPVLGGLVGGLLLGCLIWFLDPPPTTTTEFGRRPRHNYIEVLDNSSAPHGTFVTRFLALLSVVLCWAPFVGLVLAIPAVVLNRRARGWPRIVSWVGLALSAVVTALLVVILALGK